MKNASKKDDKTREPMDASVREAAVGTPATNRQRVCYAAQTLVAEVNALFPETPVEYSNYNGRNTALDVTFDLTTLDAGDRYDLTTTIGLVDSDERVAEVIEEFGAVLVSFRSNPRTQDSREPFGLADALSVMAEDDDDEFMLTSDEVVPFEIGGSL